MEQKFIELLAKNIDTFIYVMHLSYF